MEPSTSALVTQLNQLASEAKFIQGESSYQSNNVYKQQHLYDPLIQIMQNATAESLSDPEVRKALSDLKAVLKDDMKATDILKGIGAVAERSKIIPQSVEADEWTGPDDNFWIDLNNIMASDTVNRATDFITHEEIYDDLSSFRPGTSDLIRELIDTLKSKNADPGIIQQFERLHVRVDHMEKGGLYTGVKVSEKPVVAAKPDAAAKPAAAAKIKAEEKPSDEDFWNDLNTVKNSSNQEDDALSFINHPEPHDISDARIGTAAVIQDIIDSLKAKGADAELIRPFEDLHEHVSAIEAQKIAKTKM